MKSCKAQRQGGGAIKRFSPLLMGHDGRFSSSVCSHRLIPWDLLQNMLRYDFASRNLLSMTRPFLLGWVSSEINFPKLLMLMHFLWRSRDHDLPKIEDQNPITDFGDEGEIVLDHEDSFFLLL